MPRHFALLDANVVAAFYAGKSTQNLKLAVRSNELLQKAAENETQLLIPNFCIAEVFSVLEKYRWGKGWNRHVSSANTLSGKEFDAARTQFSSAIHNGASILQVELNRYHVLCADLISPINHAYQIKRKVTKKIQVRPASTYDMLIISMGIWLQHIHGADSFTIVTGDARIGNVVKRAKSISLRQTMKSHLTGVASGLGLSYSPALYPEVLNLAGCTRVNLQTRFPWCSA